MKKLTRERVVLTSSASVSWLTSCDDADDGNAGYEALGSDHGIGPLTVAQPDGTEKIRVGPSVGF